MRRPLVVGATALTAAACGSSSLPPAGRHIVFTHFTRGEPDAVWIADADGRHAHKLVHPGAFPLVSRDGRLIAYTRNQNRDLWVVRSDSRGAKRLARGTAPLGWLPANRVLALKRGALVAVDARTGRTAVLDAGAHAGTAGIGGWDVSPNGRSVVYARPTGSGHDLYVVDLATKRVGRLTTDGRSTHPVWGTWIAFRRSKSSFSSGIWLVRASGRGLRPFAARPQRRFTRYGYYGYEPFAWLVPGKRLLIGLVNEWGDEAAILDADGRVQRLRYYVDGVSRDRRWFVGMQGGAEVPFDIMIVRIRDRRARVVAHGDYCCPSWNR